MTADIQHIIKERVLILDGAMGTVIQQYGLTEADFRGTRFSESVCQLKGNNDILCLTDPISLPTSTNAIFVPEQIS